MSRSPSAKDLSPANVSSSLCHRICVSQGSFMGLPGLLYIIMAPIAVIRPAKARMTLESCILEKFSEISICFHYKTNYEGEDDVGKLHTEEV